VELAERVMVSKSKSVGLKVELPVSSIVDPAGNVGQGTLTALPAPKPGSRAPPPLVAPPLIPQVNVPKRSSSRKPLMPATSIVADVLNVPPVVVERVQVGFPPKFESSKPAPWELLRMVTVAPMPQPPPPPPPPVNGVKLKNSTFPTQVTPDAVQAGIEPAYTMLVRIGKMTLTPTKRSTRVMNNPTEAKYPSPLLIRLIGNSLRI